MGEGSDTGGSTTLSPEEAFGILGNETRLGILRTLLKAEKPLTFSTVRDRVGRPDSGQFNYHLDKLEGNFIRKIEDGYEIKRAGRRVIQAIFSGIITDDPVLEPTPVEEPCPYCDDRTVVAFHQGQVEQYCPGCAGHYSQEAVSDEMIGSRRSGFLGSFPLPPAGLRGRTAGEVQQAALTWGTLEYLAVASGVCPRCSAALAKSVDVCEAHDPGDGLCDQCRNSHAVQFQTRCPNCYYEQTGTFVLALMANLDVLEFLVRHGINPVTPQSYADYDAALMDYEEEIQSVDPFEARFTFTIGNSFLEITVNDDLAVVDVTKGTVPETA